MTVLPARLTVRAFAEADREAVTALWRAVGLTRPWNDPDADLDLARSTGHGVVLVARETEDGPPVGSVLVGHDAHRAYMYYLAVAPDRQGRGYGRRLVQAAEEWATAKGLPKMHLFIRDTNAAVAGFYQNLGYQLSPNMLWQRWLGNDPADAPKAQREVTITYLEMTAHPGPAHPPPPALQMALLRAHEPTVSFYRYLYETVGARWMWWQRRVMSDAQLRRIIHDPGVEIYVLYVQGVPGGFVEIDRRRTATPNIQFLGLVEEFIGRGLGRYIIDWAVRRAWDGDTAKVTINTCDMDHPRALGMYQRAGFLPVRRQTIMIDDPAPLIQGRGP